jgi:hypothetical protein
LYRYTTGIASRRCRHTTAGVGPLVFVCGGLRGGNLLGDMYVSEVGLPLFTSSCSENTN